MLSFIAQRLFQSLLVMLTVALIAFAMFRTWRPLATMVGQDTTAEQREQLREQLGLNDPFVVQYARFVANAARGDFGTSYRHRRPVSELLEERLPATLELSFVSVHGAGAGHSHGHLHRARATACCPRPSWPSRWPASRCPPS